MTRRDASPDGPLPPRNRARRSSRDGPTATRRGTFLPERPMMASVEPYSPCPCGSGQKFKWCCHKVESYADRAQRLLEGGQTEAALRTLDDGLKKEPGNAWLLTRKALILTRENRPDEAKETVRAVLHGNPKHPGALVLLTRLALETEGPAAGAAQFQQAMSA